MRVVVMSRKARIGVWEPLRSYFLGAEGMEMERLRKEKGDLLGIGSQNPFLPLKTNLKLVKHDGITWIHHY